MNKQTIAVPRSGHYSRRQFLARTGACGAGLLVFRSRREALGYAANEKLNLAIIGAGGRGGQNLNDVAGESIVALCDVDQRQAAESFQKYPAAAKYADFRRLLTEMERQIDAVVVSTTNHVHAPASVMAMRMGKHCYCEKPLSHSVREARLAAKVAAEMKVATQMGTQIHASDNYRRVVELLRAGAIGPVRECHCFLPSGGAAGDRPQDTPAVPPELDWDLWVGPAPLRPYHPCYVPHDWHSWWDFGGGASGIWGATTSIWHSGRWISGIRSRLRPAGRPCMGKAHPPGNTCVTNFRARRRSSGCAHLDSRRNCAAAVSRTEISGVGLGRIRRRQGTARGQLRPARAVAGRHVCRLSSRLNPTCPPRWGITRNGSTPAKPAARPPAISTTPAPSRKPSCWATSPTGPARDWNGTQPT